jgi:hypothetical protein
VGKNIGSVYRKNPHARRVVINGNQLPTRHGRLTLHFGIENLLPFVPSTHVSSLARYANRRARAAHARFPFSRMSVALAVLKIVKF